MNCCIRNPLQLCWVGINSTDEIKTGIVAEQAGKYTLLLPFLGTMITLQKEVKEGEKISFPSKDLNEYFEYQGYIVAPNGERMAVTDGILTYDGLQFVTKWRDVVREESGS